PARIGEAQVDVLDVLVLDSLEDLGSVAHVSLLVDSVMPAGANKGRRERRRNSLDRVESALAGADADGLLDRGDEDLSVADAAGLGSVPDRLDGALDEFIRKNNFDLNLGKKIHHVFGAAIKLGVALLTA